MDLFQLGLLVAALLASASAGAVAVAGAGTAVGDAVEEDGLDDFPLDDGGGGASDRSDEGGGDNDFNELEDINLSEAAESESSRQELLKKVMVAAMAKPGARQRLAQVMPILRTMSAPQRLALAGLVTSQLMAAPGAPPPPVPRNNATRTNLTDDLMIPISMDIAAMFRGLGRDSAARSSLFRGDLYKRHPPYRRRPTQNLNRRNTEVPYEEMRPPPPPRVKLPKIRLPMTRPPAPVQPSTGDQVGSDCEQFTNTVCLQVSDYPMEAILKSIQSTPNKNAFEALRLDAKLDLSAIQSTVPGMERRQGDNGGEGEVEEGGAQDNGLMCSSKVEVARPKRARATSGQWKYVVNTGDYTQTLRLEMCLKAKQPCYYLTDNLKSECTQVYNYHRLLTWDQKSGLTMDIFKVPTCCSCHVHSRSFLLTGKRTDTSFAASESVRVSQQPPTPTRATPAYGEAPENNFVVAEDIPAVQRLHPPKLIRTRRPLLNLHNIPKRESQLSRVKPSRQPTPVQAEDSPPSPPPARYPLQYENLLRRTSPRNHSEYHESRPKYHPVQPTLNQRHPELPVDSLLADNAYSYVTSVPDYQPPPRPPPPRRAVYTTTPFRRPSPPPQPPPPTTMPPPATTPAPGQLGGSKRVNYSYHPIIDFFKTSVTAAEATGEKMTNAEWTPITDGTRVMTK